MFQVCGKVFSKGEDEVRHLSGDPARLGSKPDSLAGKRTTFCRFFISFSSVPILFPELNGRDQLHKTSLVFPRHRVSAPYLDNTLGKGFHTSHQLSISSRHCPVSFHFHKMYNKGLKGYLERATSLFRKWGRHLFSSQRFSNLRL